MKNKKLLTVILLSLSFCFVVTGVGCGEIKEYLLGTKAEKLEFELLKVKVNYMMFYPDSFLRVSYYYDETGWIAENFPAGVSTKDKIVVQIIDSRDVFSGKSGAMLLLEFRRQLLDATYFLEILVSDLENDIVVLFTNEDSVPLGYFYQSGYHLWDE